MATRSRSAAIRMSARCSTKQRRWCRNAAKICLSSDRVDRGFSEWGHGFGDPVVAAASLDRLLHHAAVIQIDGANYRLREHADLVPEKIRPKSLIQPRRSSQLSNVVAGRPKTELLIKTTADHLARQTGEFYFAIMWEIPCAIDCTKRIGSLSGMVGGSSASELRRVMSIWLRLDGELLNVLHDQVPMQPTR